ncbi:MAG: TetR/AcrR family transcriptional regulator [Ruminococcaceae bacterium]|nr:TetR/AcrR family transcriptional regulator [Oscillospiraceae bacterium]
MTELEKQNILRMTNAESNALTKSCLHTAMCKLLAKKGIDQITVSELVQVAGVSRNAFYRNYESKEALVAEICRDVTERLSGVAHEWLKIEEKEDWMISIFRYIRANQATFKLLADAELPLSETIEAEIRATSESSRNLYTSLARAGIFVSILRNWFGGGMKEQPEEIGALCNKFMAGI